MLSRVGGDGCPVTYTSIYTNRNFSMSENEIDDELYEKIVAFCLKVDIDFPEQKDYNACMIIIQRMKDIAIL